MYKKAILIIGVILVISACSATVKTTPKHNIGMANPASEYCIQKGGQLEMKKNADGSEYANCILANGQVIEEWELFRKDHAMKQ